ncbi:MBL fold metallo-hydrolase [Rhodococcus opacus]|uniref:MBL fold metallo-hydrolase n=1 Tax=Rhodococcus opacus TaxID=37919 RepID=UPI001F55AE61|nr:MBL fold metallo-hydrolase [Rhodococcus opacus]UNN05258.1 MBL fold metallo-hydrolase [Rhodococcus opacus]
MVLTLDQPYTGHVSPGSNPQLHNVDGGRIIKMSVAAGDNNVYLIECTTTGQALLIDAANEPERVVALVKQEAPDLRLVVTTHQHIDHWWALKDVVAATGAPTAAHPLDAEALPVTPNRSLVDGDKITIGVLTFEVIHLRGHTPGSIALALTERDRGRTHLFTGDSLFPGGIGKTAEPENFDTLITDVETKIFDRYPDNTLVYPGHGDDTTLGVERPHLTEWRQRGW